MKQALNEMLEYDSAKKIHCDSDKLDLVVFVASYKPAHPSPKKD